jgi:hypothetical protein
VVERRPGDDAGDVGGALRVGLADGLREHLPGAVGLVTKGTPLCVFAAFAHFALGASSAKAVIAMLGGGFGTATAIFARRYLSNDRAARPSPTEQEQSSQKQLESGEGGI